MPTETTKLATQTIEELTARYQQLNEQKIKAQSDLQHAQNRLDEFKTKARQEYGTDDLEKLKRLLDERKRQNEEDRANYQEGLNEIENELGEIDRKYSSTEQGHG